MRVGPDHLAVAEADREHQHRERRPDRQRELQLGRAGEHEDRHHRFRSVGHRGERVGREDGEREQAPHALLGDRRAAQRRADQHPAQRVGDTARPRVSLAPPQSLLRARRHPPRVARCGCARNGRCAIAVDRRNRDDGSTGSARSQTCRGGMHPAQLRPTSPSAASARWSSSGSCALAVTVAPAPSSWGPSLGLPRGLSRSPGLSDGGLGKGWLTSPKVTSVVQSLSDSTWISDVRILTAKAHSTLPG